MFLLELMMSCSGGTCTEHGPHQWATYGAFEADKVSSTSFQRVSYSAFIRPMSLHCLPVKTMQELRRLSRSLSDCQSLLNPQYHDTRLDSSLIHQSDPRWIWHLFFIFQSFRSNHSLISHQWHLTRDWKIKNWQKSKRKKMRVAALQPPLSLWNTGKFH